MLARPVVHVTVVSSPSLSGSLRWVLPLCVLGLLGAMERVALPWAAARDRARLFRESAWALRTCVRNASLARADPHAIRHCAVFACSLEGHLERAPLNEALRAALRGRLRTVANDLVLGQLPTRDHRDDFDAALDRALRAIEREVPADQRPARPDEATSLPRLQIERRTTHERDP